MTALPRYVLSSTSLNRVEHPLRWRRSSRSTGMNNCVETAALSQGSLSGLLAVRDSKDTAGPALVFAPAAWSAFLDAVRGEEL
ncbi:DUF397 domain-containing protein [Streptomyces indicus]|uniref:DUF397 domain-containing protein n=1 Tax=Streptomyces indicus TaxID=417292 RepID=A0A1G8ZYG3_9ACTN|nr:DUF397 domain-containing protein [Streptomyces indicus]SDK20148.1 protein of unknown function [Streptomyces indicus]